MTTHHHIEISEEAFDNHYPLRLNHLNPSAGWAFIDEGGCLFETHGEELAYVLKQDPRHVWTLVDCGDSDDQYLLNGIHIVNRLGYLISEVKWPVNADIQVRLPREYDADGMLIDAGANP